MKNDQSEDADGFHDHLCPKGERKEGGKGQGGERERERESERERERERERE